MEKLLYTISEAGELIGRRKSAAYAMASAGELETVLVGSQRMVPAEALRSLVDRLRAEAKTDRTHRFIDLVDADGRIDVSLLPDDATLADLAEVKRLVAERQAVA